MARRTFGLALFVAVAATPVPACSEAPAKWGLGKSILEAKCGGCHATGRAGASPLEKAPAFRDLHRKYRVEQLAEALAEGITTGHADMPAFAFPPHEIAAIIAYLQSLSRR